MKLVKLLLAFALFVGFTSTVRAEDLTPQMCKDKALEAAAMVEAEGEAAVAKIKEIRFADGQGYVWIHNLDGMMIMHPVKPSLDGKSVTEIKDVNGVYLFVAMNEIAEEYGQGWVPYAWPKPGEEASSPKVSYVVLAKAGELDYVVGVGMYDATAADIKAAFPEDALYEE